MFLFALFLPKLHSVSCGEGAGGHVLAPAHCHGPTGGPQHALWTVDKLWEGKWPSADRTFNESPRFRCTEPQTKLHPNMKTGRRRDDFPDRENFCEHFSFNRLASTSRSDALGRGPRTLQGALFGSSCCCQLPPGLCPCRETACSSLSPAPEPWHAQHRRTYLLTGRPCCAGQGLARVPQPQSQLSQDYYQTEEKVFSAQKGLL